MIQAVSQQLASAKGLPTAVPLGRVDVLHMNTWSIKGYAINAHERRSSKLL